MLINISSYISVNTKGKTIFKRDKSVVLRK